MKYCATNHTKRIKILFLNIDIVPVTAAVSCHSKSELLKNFLCHYYIPKSHQNTVTKALIFQGAAHEIVEKKSIFTEIA